MIVRERAFGRILFGRTALQGAIIVAIVAAAGATAAQTGPGVPNALQGLSQNGDKPVQIKAQTFEVRDKDKIATFSGNVHVVQGDTTIRCKSLIVTYASDTVEGGARAAQPGPGGKSQISKLEALGGVIVTQNDQTATGERGIFDLRTKIVTLIGNVVVSQGGNVMRGDRLVVDLNTNISRLESGKARGVEMLIDQSKSNAPKPGGTPAREAPRLDQLRPAQSN
jgi:lipopolysaccharide export system protein LptA